VNRFVFRDLGEEANQLRLWFAAIAYVLLDSLRRLALQATDLADATLRHKRLKICALVTARVYRIRLAMASGRFLQGRVCHGPSRPARGSRRHRLS
jgi:hypothetical protein